MRGFVKNLVVFIDPKKSNHLLVTHSFWRWWWRTPTTWHSLILWHFFYWIPRQIRYFFLFCRFFCDGEVAHPRRSRKITQLPKKAKHENTIHLHDYGFQMFRVLYVVVGIPDGMDYFQVFGHFVWCPLEENTICIYIYIYILYIRCASFRLCWTRDPMVCNLQAFIISSVAGVPNLVWQPYLGLMFTPIPGETIQFEEYFSNGWVQPPPNYIVWGVSNISRNCINCSLRFLCRLLASRAWLAWSLPGYQHHSCAHSWLPSGVVGRMKRVEFDGVCCGTCYIIDLSISFWKYA